MDKESEVQHVPTWWIKTGWDEQGYVQRIGDRIWFTKIIHQNGGIAKVVPDWMTLEEWEAIPADERKESLEEGEVKANGIRRPRNKRNGTKVPQSRKPRTRNTVRRRSSKSTRNQPGNGKAVSSK